MPYSPRGDFTANITVTSPRAGTSNLTRVLKRRLYPALTRTLTRSEGKPAHAWLNTGHLLAVPRSVDTKDRF